MYKMMFFYKEGARSDRKSIRGPRPPFILGCGEIHDCLGEIAAAGLLTLNLGMLQTELRAGSAQPPLLSISRQL